MVGGGGAVVLFVWLLVGGFCVLGFLFVWGFVVGWGGGFGLGFFVSVFWLGWLWGVFSPHNGTLLSLSFCPLPFSQDRIT